MNGWQTTTIYGLFLIVIASGGFIIRELYAKNDQLTQNQSVQSERLARTEASLEPIKNDIHEIKEAMIRIENKIDNRRQ